MLKQPQALTGPVSGEASSLLKRYTKKHQIGAGAFGACYIAKAANGTETVVMKEVELKGLDAKELRRAVMEAKVLQRLKHPNLVSYRDAQISDRDMKLYIVMEHAAGGDLAGLILERSKAGRRFGEEEVRKVAAQACSALAYCHHQQYLLHRDIKPQNIFLSSARPTSLGRTPGNVKIGDFGMSTTLAASHGLAITKCGSPLYMSPELCGGRPYDRGCDVWALGCVLLEMMSLSPPWLDQLAPHQNGIMPLMRLICNGSLNVGALRRHYSPELCSLLTAMLSRSPKQRPSFRHLMKVPVIAATLKSLQADRAAAPQPTEAQIPSLTPPLTPASTPSSTPPASEPEEDECGAVEEEGDINATGEGPTERILQLPLHPLTAAAAAAKHVNIDVDFGMCHERAKGHQRNPFNPRILPVFQVHTPLIKAHGVDAHAAAIALQRSFQRRRAHLARQAPAGKPSRPQLRPAWALMR